MINKLLEEFIEVMLEYGITVSIFKDMDDRILFDVDTCAKSHLYLECIDDKVYAHTRYNKCEEIYNFASLIILVDECRYGRDYINGNWKYIIANYYDE